MQSSLIEHKKEVEERKKEKELKEKELKSNLKKRKVESKKLLKRTKKGQPLMKYQIPNLLQKIEKRINQSYVCCIIFEQALILLSIHSNIHNVPTQICLIG